jgi:hypothetical protein
VVPQRHLLKIFPRRVISKESEPALLVLHLDLLQIAANFEAPTMRGVVSNPPLHNQSKRDQPFVNHWGRSSHDVLSGVSYIATEIRDRLACVASEVALLLLPYLNFTA